MEKYTIAGLEINKRSFKDLFFNKTMFFSYILIFIAILGVIEIFELRYFSEVATANSLGAGPVTEELKNALRNAIFGDVGEISREVPWTLFIANYMYMIYTGSGIIFLVALAELLNFKVVEKLAASFMVIGLAMVFAGLFTIATDLNLLNMHWMFITPNVNTGMWLMLPLYLTYIPFVLFEIYLILTNKRELAKKLAFPILVMSIGVDLIEYYIQAKLFSMNTARHLWTEFPALMFYFIISAFVSSLGIMGVLSYLVHRDKSEYKELMALIRKAMLFFIYLLAIYEVIGYLVIDKDWAFIILFGEFRLLYFGGYILFTLVLPFLLLFRIIKHYILASCISTIIGGFIGRYLFVYGGNANPMSDRFGVGYEKYNFYDMETTFNYVTPHLGEVLITIGSIGIIIAIYKLVDTLFSINEEKEIL
ncbi:NrfD/PsrC family molybdoenzyme membrane anchor subunit [Halarcobacter sp.]|uniref:NrfD/PsrC family molybdoenzyme membrane anchor subunit n=1 Tax=Halarcobacter sp. TaxID=2321133 RepID=UPI002AA763BD|nr:NrfD/PsrC family molybdoenzyme membrane anchor subunit [Halarcobacter sp.]